MINTSVNLGGLEMPTFLATASGTFGYGFEYVGAVDYSKLGAVTAKGIRVEQWPGNAMPRHAEVPGGLVNVHSAVVSRAGEGRAAHRQHLGLVRRGICRGRRADGRCGRRRRDERQLP